MRVHDETGCAVFGNALLAVDCILVFRSRTSKVFDNVPTRPEYGCCLHYVGSAAPLHCCVLAGGCSMDHSSGKHSDSGASRLVRCSMLSRLRHGGRRVGSNDEVRRVLMLSFL